MVLFTAAFFCSLSSSAQEQKPFVAHEVIEIGGGQKIEILRCRGEGPVEECDCIYYTDKRQNGKRQWQNANQIRQEQKSAQLEVAAAKELAKTEAQKMAEAKAKEMAERKSAKEKERTASSETNEVIETIKDQNKEIKSKGAVKANAYRGSAAVAKQKAIVAETKKTTMSLKEIARQRDSINRSKMPKQDEVVADSESPTVEKEEVKVKQEMPVRIAEPKTQPVVTKSEENPMSDTTGVVDFETLRKMEETHGNTSYEPPVKSATEEKPATPEVSKSIKTDKTHLTSQTPEESPAPKPAKVEEPMVDTTTKELMMDTLQSGSNIPVPPTDTIVGPVSESSDKTETEGPATIQTEPLGNSEESLKETMKDEMSKVENSEIKAAEKNIKKKEKKEKKAKKEKKNKKQNEEEALVAPPPPTEAPIEDAPLTELQKAAKAADSVRKAKAESDTTTTPAPEEKKDFGANRNKYNNATQGTNLTIDSTSVEALEANKFSINKKKLIRISGRI